MSFQPEERVILDLKYKSKRISEMEEMEISANVKALILKTAVITGWQFPDDDAYMTVFKDQFRKKMIESYGNLNIDEFEYAIRTYGTQIKDWGKAMNLSLIDEAIQNYLQNRTILSKYEENIKNKAHLPALAAGPADWSDEWEKIKTRAAEGKIDDIIITTAVYDWLDRTGKINLSNEDKEELMNKALDLTIGELENKKLSSGFDRSIQIEINKLKSGEWRKDKRMFNKIINKAKIQAIKTFALSKIEKDA